MGQSREIHRVKMSHQNPQLRESCQQGLRHRRRSSLQTRAVDGQKRKVLVTIEIQYLTYMKGKKIKKKSMNTKTKQNDAKSQFLL